MFKKKLFTGSIFLICAVSFFAFFPEESYSDEVIKGEANYIPADLAIDTTKDIDSIGLILRIDGSLTELENLGVAVRSRIGKTATRIITTRVPVSMIDTIASLPSVIVCELAKKVHTNLNISSYYVDAPLGRDFFGVKGDGVIIGVVDREIDLTNPDFRNGPYDTRIIYLWNQKITSGQPPSPYNYGSEYTKADIDGGYVQIPAYDNHGTMVTGVAAGSGRKTGNQVPESTYVGIAHGSSIIFVDGRMVPDAATGMMASDFVLDGITYIINKADSLDMPCVINLSLGIASGPRDGTSLIECAIDSLLVNHAGKGLAVVVAAGNKGYDPYNPEVIYHDSVSDKWAQNKNHATFYGNNTLNVEAGGSVDYEDKLYIDIWYPGNESCSVIVHTPDPYFVAGPFGPGQGTTFSPCQGLCTSFGFISVQNERWGTGLCRDPWPNSPDNVIRIQLADRPNCGGTPDTAHLAPGVWGIEMRNTSGRWDAYMITAEHRPQGYVSFFQTWTNSGKVEEPGCAGNVITVGSFNTKNTWYDLNGNLVPNSGSPQFMQAGYPVGSVSFFSSEGPTRDGRPKPEIYAPGAWVASSLSPDPRLHSSHLRWCIATDSSHFHSYGTSFSAPHVSGTIALMLEFNDTLSYQSIKDALMQSATVDGFLDTYAALAEVGCIPGDANGDRDIDLIDITYLIDYLYKGGSAPVPYALCSGDAECGNCAVNLLDITRIINYLYDDGPAPCTCHEWLDSCGAPLR